MILIMIMTYYHNDCSLRNDCDNHYHNIYVKNYENDYDNDYDFC